MKLWITTTFFGILIAIAGVFLPSEAVLKIPENLIQCYRNVTAKPLVPQNLQVLLELLRKVENQNVDIRTLAVSLVHKLRLDGIQRNPNIQETEYVTPYDANGNQVPKDEILLKLISPMDPMINFENYLNPDELCHLHKLISSSVDSYERGDEARTCRKYNSINPDKVLISKTGRVHVVKSKISQCPMEMGTIRTPQFGTVSPGTVIASIAAGLEPQRVAISEFLRYENLEDHHLMYNSGKLDNTFASNLAGDLAEVCVYQSPYYETNVSVGTVGFWNHTDYPLKRYLEENNVLNWAMTDAEILGGIDGITIASNIRGWVHKIQKLRLSEVIEMYYSIKGVPNLSIEQGRQWGYSSMNNSNQYDSMSESGCDRIKSLGRISRDKLKEQTFNFAQILQQFSPTVRTDDDLLRKACDAAVDKFYIYAQDLVLKTTKCKNCSRHPIDLTVVLDGSRNQFESMMLVSSLTEMVDVSKFGSRISVMNGNTGDYMVNPTHSVTKVFEDLKGSYGNFPTWLSLERSLLSISSRMDIENANKTNDWAGLSQVILLVSQNQQISTDAFDRAKTILQSEFAKYHDLYFIFLTNIPDTYKELVSATLPATHFFYVETTKIEPNEFSVPLMRTFRNIKKYLHIPPCIKGRGPDSYPDTTVDSYEDYVSRQQDNYYQINSNELSQTRQFYVKFQGVSYGSITVCMQRVHDNFECLSTMYNEFESIQFNITSDCSGDPFIAAADEYCQPIIFRVELESSYVRCTEDDCRYPDQVRYLVQMGDMSCNGVRRSGISFLVVSLGLLVIKYLTF